MGNNELETHTNSPTNSYLSDGRLIIKAEKTGENSYSSARMKSLGLQEFQYGLIDVRAMLPKSISSCLRRNHAVPLAQWFLNYNIDDNSIDNSAISQLDTIVAMIKSRNVNINVISVVKRIIDILREM